MLYPIELLGQMTAVAAMGAATDGVHVNGQGRICHVVRGLFECRRMPARKSRVSPRKTRVAEAIVQNALPQNASIAICNPQPPKNSLKPLI